MRTRQSEYMLWAKTQSKARFNLATSGVGAFPLRELSISAEQLEINGDSTYGFSALQHAIARKCGVGASCVVAAAGTSMANHLAMAALIDPGDEVLIENPTYELIRSAVLYLGADLKQFERREENGFALDPAEIRRVLTPKTKLIILTNLPNPSSVLTPDAVLREVGDLAKSVGARVLVDEVYLDAVYENTQRTAIHLGREFIVTNSLTKVYGLSGLRCGWILAEPELARKMYRLNDLFGVNNPYVTDQLSCIALGRLREIGQWARELLDTNRALVNEFVEATPELDCEQLKVGTVLYPRIEFPVDEFCRLLRERYETVITPGHFFGSPERVRIGIGGEMSLLAEGLNRVHAALEAHSA